VRVTTAFNMLLALPGVNVTGVEFTADRVIVDARLRRRRLVCPHCDYSSAGRHNLQVTALDLGSWRVTVRARLRRLPRPRRGRGGGPVGPPRRPGHPRCRRPRRRERVTAESTRTGAQIRWGKTCAAPPLPFPAGRVVLGLHAAVGRHGLVNGAAVIDWRLSMGSQ
jgi:hypothetical protein